MSSVDLHAASSTLKNGQKAGHGTVDVIATYNTWSNWRIPLNSICFEVPNIWFTTSTLLTRSLYPILAILCKRRWSKTQRRTSSAHRVRHPIIQQNWTQWGTSPANFQLQRSMRSVPQVLPSNLRGSRLNKSGEFLWYTLHSTEYVERCFQTKQDRDRGSTKACLYCNICSRVKI